jgi:hypothetical protein
LKESCCWAGRVVQVVERLPSKYEALRSNLSTAKKKRRRKQAAGGIEQEHKQGTVAHPPILALRRLRQEDDKFEASLGYTVKPCLKQGIGVGWGG